MMTSKTQKKSKSSEEVSAEGPGEVVRGVMSLLLFIHLFCVAAALAGNFAPSPLQVSLLDRLAPYTRLLNFDLNFIPYYLTFGPPDGENRLEVLVSDAEAAPETDWVVLPPGGGRPGGDRYQRFQRLADVVAFYAEVDNDEIPSLIAQSVGSHFLHQQGIEPKQIRCRRRALQERSWIAGGTPAQRDPWHPSRFSDIYRADLIILAGGNVRPKKVERESLVAPPEQREGRP